MSYRRLMETKCQRQDSTKSNLGYFPVTSGLPIILKCQRWESNPRPQVYESCALPTELPWHIPYSTKALR